MALARTGDSNNRCIGFLSILMAIHLPSFSGVTLRDWPSFSYGVKPYRAFWELPGEN
jgi:hypothetical protein